MLLTRVADPDLTISHCLFVCIVPFPTLTKLDGLLAKEHLNESSYIYISIMDKENKKPDVSTE